jgi:hypothetical protein
MIINALYSSFHYIFSVSPVHTISSMVVVVGVFLLEAG